MPPMFLPIRTSVWPRRTPYANYALIAINVVVFLLTYDQPQSGFDEGPGAGPCSVGGGT